ncbi:hypothetical protein HDV57DRAFT_55856 [Trichoderma longibrachiatum]
MNGRCLEAFTAIASLAYFAFSVRVGRCSMSHICKYARGERVSVNSYRAMEPYCTLQACFSSLVQRRAASTCAVYRVSRAAARSTNWPIARNGHSQSPNPRGGFQKRGFVARVVEP